MRRIFSLAWFAPLLVVFWNLDYAPFWNPDEGRYAAASLEMAYPIDGGSPDWVVPHLNTAARLNKPPLVYWLSGGAFRLLGTSEASGRFPCALAAFLISVILYFWGRRAFGRAAGQCAALIWGTMAFPYAMARMLNTDMLLTFALTMAGYGIWGALRSREENGTTAKRDVLGFAFLAGIGMGLALLAKGPIGLALPLIVAFLYLCLSRSWSLASWKGLLFALALAITMAMPWFLAVEARWPEFLHEFILRENLGRFSGSNFYHTKSPFYYYVPVMLLGLVPWTGFLPGIFSGWTKGSSENRVRLYALIWACFIVAFFSASGTKLVSYVLPAFPPLALLLGAAASRWEGWPKRWRATALTFSAFLNVAFLVAAGVFLLDGKTLPRHEVMPILVTLGAILGVAFLALMRVGPKGAAKPLIVVQVLTACALFLALGPIANRIARYEDGSTFFRELGPHLQPGDRVIGFHTFLPAVVYYVRRPVYYFGFVNTSGLRDAELRTNPYFPCFSSMTEVSMVRQNATLKQVVRGHRSWICADGRLDEDVEKELHLWGRNNDFFFYSTEAKPVGFECDYVSPGNRYKEDRALAAAAKAAARARRMARERERMR